MLRPRPAALTVALALALACGSGTDGARPAAGPAAPEPPPVPERPPASLPEAPDEPAVALPDLSDPAWTRVVSRAGTYTVHWRPEPAPIVRNQDFELRVWVLRDGAPVGPEAALSVSAWMPDHGHGMLRRTEVARQADGSYRVEGMLLHMRGHWQVFFELLEGTIAETAEQALDL